MDLDPQKLLEQTALGTLWLGSWQNRRALIRALPRGGLKGASLIRQAVRIPARVSHESIAPILAYGEITEELAEATELQEGCLWMAAAPPWPQTLDETSLTWPELWNVVDQLLRALAKIHAQGIIHGDLKAELVEVLGGGARLRDVGLLFAAAREGLVEPDSSDERLAPEFRHRRWREVGPWTDLYPLGWMVRNRSKGLDVPKALDEWVDRLLNRRVVRASIALRELKEIAGEVQQSFYPDVARTGPLLDPGLGLMGRESEQKQLWEALHRVEAGEPCVVLLEGPSGSGRTALVQWLANEGEQRAIATVLRSRYGPTGAVRGGLGRLIVEHLGCMGLEGTDLETRVTTHLRSWGIAETWEIRSLLGVIDPASFPMRPGDARLRHAVVRRFLQACASQRRPGEWAQSEPTPLIVVLEDVQWGLEALSFARALLQSADLPVLLVMTLNTDEVLWPGTESEWLTRLFEKEDRRLSRITLRPIGTEDLTRLAATRLEEASAGELAVAARGNPLYVVQVLDGVEDQQVPQGLPTTLAEALLERLEEREIRFALELLACLGTESPLHEWERVCTDWGLTPRTDWLEDLADRGIVALEADGSRVRFVHTALRQALLGAAEREGRLEAQHRTCAAALTKPGSRNAAARIGGHHIGAGDVHLAMQHLLDGAAERLEGGRTEAAMKLLASAANVVDRMREGVDEQQLARLWTLQAEARMASGQFAQAVEAAEQAVQRARWSAGPSVLGRALRARARTAQRIGDLSQALGALREAKTLLVGAESAGISNAMGRVLGDLGDLDEAAAEYEVARKGFMVSGDRAGLADSQRGLGDIAVRRGDVEWAATLLESAREAYSEVGSAWGASACHNSLGELWRRRGDLQGAEHHYRKAALLTRGSGDVESLVPDLNRGVVLELQGRHGEAQRVLLSCLRLAESHGARLLAAACHVVLLPALAGTGDWSALDAHYDQGKRLLIETGYVDPDLAWLARRAAEAADEPRRIRQLTDLALQQYRRLGEMEEVAELQARLAELP